MRRLLIRSVLSVLALAILAVAWIFAGPGGAQAIGAIHTTRLASATSFSIRKYSGFFHFLFLFQASEFRLCDACVMKPAKSHLSDVIQRFRNRGLGRFFQTGDTSGINAQHVLRL